MTKYFPFGSQTYTLGSSIGSSETTILLSSFTEPVTGTPYTMALLNTDIAYGTIGPKTSSSEFISFTGITQNADGTATLTGVVRGLAKKYPFTTNASYKLPHAGQTIFIISDVPQVFYKYSVIENDETITGLKTFSQFPITPSSAPTTDYQVANKKYIDDIAIAGGANASSTVKGISKLSIDPVSPTNPIAVGNNDTRVPTQGENDALVGNNIDIAVGTGNKFVTQTGLQHNAEKYAADAGASDTYVITLSPVPTSYTNGMVVHFKANTINTGAATLNVNGLGAKTIVKNYNVTLENGDIKAGQLVSVIYDGTNFQMISSTPVSNIFGAITSSNLKYSANTERSYEGSLPTKVKEISCKIYGVASISFDTKVSSNQYNSRIYINGSAVGINRNGTDTSYVTYTENITIHPEDLIQLYISTNVSSGVTVYARNFRISYDFGALESMVVVTD